jgi:hypothetical protein
LPESAVKQIMPATKQGGSYTAGQLVEAAQRLYEVHHIHLAHHRSGHVPDDWDRLLGPDHVHIAQGEERIPEIIIDIVADHPDSDFKAVTMKKDDIAPDLVEEQVVL